MRDEAGRVPGILAQALDEGVDAAVRGVDVVVARVGPLVLAIVRGVMV
ncbi:MAG: hypothetical protein ACREQ5_30910 [Candidatus Dormibacteria bacterium]